MDVRTETVVAIDQLIAAFFAVFDNHGGRQPDVGRMRELFAERGVLAKCVASAPEISTVEEFIAPRQELLTSGALTDFEEVETSATTQVFGHIAHRQSTYRKSGLLHGAPFVTRGVKSFQFLETPAGWRILSVTWDDEREGFAVP